MLFFLASDAQDSDNLADSVASDTIGLNEIKVTARQVTHYVDRDEFLLSRTDREHGSNALDAISSLPVFNISLNAKELTTRDNRQVIILIDGRETDGLDLRTYQAENIKKVVYYSVPPAKYMNRGTNVAVVDIITRRVRNTFFSSYLTTDNSVNQILGNNQLSLVFADSLNRLTASYNEWHNDVSSIQTSETYDYDFIDSRSSYRSSSGKQKNFGQTVELSYQHYFGRDLFHVGAQCNIYPNRSVTPSEILLDDGGVEMTGSRRSATFGRSNSWVIGLYYRHSMRDGRNLTFQATAGRSRWYTNSYLERAMDDAQFSSLDYDIQSSIQSEGYYGYLSASFDKKLWGGRFAAGINANVQTSEQSYTGEPDADIDNFDGNAYAAYSGSLKRLYYNLNVGLYLNHQRNSISGNDTHCFFIPSLNLGYNFTDMLSLRLSATVQKRRPSLSELSSAETAIDTYYVTRGNPYLKTNYCYWVQLSPQYVLPGGRAFLGANVSYSYWNNFIAPVITIDGNKVVRQSMNIGKTPSFFSSVFVSWQVCRWLRVMPTLWYSRYNMHTPSNNSPHNSWCANLQITAPVRNVEFSLYGSLPQKDRTGDYLTESRWSGMFSVLWRYRSITLGSKMFWFGASRNWAEIPGFKYSSQTRNRYEHNLAQVTFSWYFSRGKARQQEQVEISTQGFEK